jgi:hypothetical protein
MTWVRSVIVLVLPAIYAPLHLEQQLQEYAVRKSCVARALPHNRQIPFC